MSRVNHGFAAQCSAITRTLGPLNHQVQVLYANMLFDESFEQTPLNGYTLGAGCEMTSVCRGHGFVG